MPDPDPFHFALVGSGFRALAYLRVAAALPDRLRATAVLSRNPAGAAVRLARFGVPVVGSLAELAGPARPDFVLTSVTSAVNPGLLVQLVESGHAVLSETPPASDEAALLALWAAVGAGGRVQVAEQYRDQPMNAARLQLVRDGVLGTPTSAQVSITQLYHAVSLLRGALGVGFADAEVRAVAARSPLMNPVTRAGWTGDREPLQQLTTWATLDFGSAVGVYDFTETQTRNPLRASRFLIRGSHGELSEEQVRRLADPRTVLQAPIVRRQTGLHADFEVPDLDQISFEGRVVYRNPYYGARLSDEEIALATMLERTGRWSRGVGPAPYPLAEAAQDHLLGLAIGQAARTGAPVRTAAGPWADGG